MRIDVIGRGIDITDAIREHTETHVGKLPRYYDRVQQIEVTVAQLDHTHHPTFDVEMNIHVEHHDAFICHARSDDVYSAIDQATQKGVRLLTDFKDRLRTEKR
ncbi:MAG: ribosome-associated translation inhibitor RaiA [Phycisphaeraceae bacterium]|nr:ribosome-associated translation inhibitor RaiA [Phycisphaerales bacterium]MCB9859300.1 ribosome-associated translation inhibitor RaiA [Phycisphaeraceae bacterium]